MTEKTEKTPADAAAIRFQDLKDEFISVAEMQRRIMPDPEQAPVFGEFDFFGKTLPMAEVGGDFYTFIDMEARFGINGRMGIVIADAAGHGLAAAMLIRDFNTGLHMAISFQSYYVQDTTPLLFSKVNRRMYRSSGPNQFISAFYSELQLNGTIRYMNAGHPSPLLFKMNGEVVPLRTGGPLLGAFPDAPNDYEVGQDVIANGDLLVCCTDGITEAMDPAGREYGFQRLEGVVQDNRRSGAQTIFNAILEDVDRFCDGRSQEDDRTLIVIRRGSVGD